MTSISKQALLILTLAARASPAAACETPKCSNCSRKEFINRVAACALKDINAAVLRNFQSKPAHADCLSRSRNDHMEPADGCLQDAMRDDPNAQFRYSLLTMVNGAAISVGGRVPSETERQLILFEMYGTQLKSANPKDVDPALIGALTSGGFNPRPLLEAIRQLEAPPDDAAATVAKIRTMPLGIRRMVVETENGHISAALNNSQTRASFIALAIEAMDGPDDVLEFIASKGISMNLESTTLELILKAIRKAGDPPQIMANGLCVLTDVAERSEKSDSLKGALAANRSLFTSVAPMVQRARGTYCSLPGGKIEADLSVFYARVMKGIFGVASPLPSPTIRYDQPATAAKCSHSQLAAQVSDYLTRTPPLGNMIAAYNDAKGCIVNLAFVRERDGGVLISVAAAGQKFDVTVPKTAKDNIGAILGQLPWKN